MNDDDLSYMAKAIHLARKCSPEDGRIHPCVAAIVVLDGKELATAYRGEMQGGQHAEYTALEEKLKATSVSGATVYTTLEPCTNRNSPKLACVERLVERKVKRVVIGTLDPNPAVSGKGVQRLREANIEVIMAGTAQHDELVDLNRDFARSFKSSSATRALSSGEQEALERRSLDEWYIELNHIYWNKNFYRDPNAIFAHLVEVIGALSLLGSDKRKPGVEPKDFVPKALAWWMALCGKLGVPSIERMLWRKFPGVCTYCREAPHTNWCVQKKRQANGPDWEALRALGNRGTPPRRLSDWQRMFSSIYPAHQTETLSAAFARLTEELGELAEALRVFPAEPGYFLSEASDVFAWLMKVQNLIEAKAEIEEMRHGAALDAAFAKSYPFGCKDCSQPVCVCPPILEGTIGRIAHEVPRENESQPSFMTADQARRLFATRR